MKKLNLFVLMMVVVSLVLSTAIMADANPYTWVDVVSVDARVSPDNFISYTHELDPFFYGETSINDYFITLTVTSGIDEWEITFNQADGLSNEPFYEFDLPYFSVLLYNGSEEGITQLCTDGILDIKIGSDFGFFNVKKSILIANGSTPVPEPATMILFGIGLIGTGIVTRKKKKS